MSYLKRIKKYSFLIWVLLLGCLYLTEVDSWQVYAKPLGQVQIWYRDWQSKGTEAFIAGFLRQDNSVDTGVSLGDAGTVSAGDDNSTEQEESSESNGSQSDVNGTNQGESTKQGDGSNDGSQSNDGGMNQDESMPAATPSSRAPEDVVYVTASDDYFSDAVFIGDSRTVGLYEYAGMEDKTTFYASTGLTVYKMFDSPIIQVPGQRQKQTIEEALQQNQFSKIYLMIGINEMGTGTVETFIEKYKEAVEKLQELQPDAIIYLQGIMKVTTKRSEQGDYINNEGIEERNAEIAKLADYVKVYYLDVNPMICDDTGGMEPSYTFDGVHLKAQYIPIWMDFLKTHAILLD